MTTEDILKLLIETEEINKYAKLPINITFIGGPGSGKSTVAKMICEKMNLYWFCPDKVRRLLDLYNLSNVNHAENQKSLNSIIIPFQLYLLSSNVGFVIDANRMNATHIIKERADKYGYKLFVLKIECINQTALLRLERRLKMSDDANFSKATKDDFDRYLKDLENFNNSDSIFATINTEEGNLDKQVDEIISKIRKTII